MKITIPLMLAFSAMFPHMFAQVPSPATASGIEWGSVEHFGGVIAQFGIAFLGLYWFATRMERRMGGVERSIDRFSKTLLIEVVTRSTISEPAKQEAKKMLDEIKTKEQIQKSRDTDPPFLRGQ